MTLVHIPKWNLGPLSKSISKEREEVALPLLPLPNLSPGSSTLFLTFDLQRRELNARAYSGAGVSASNRVVSLLAIN
jgi:hypothetical protein